MQLQAHACAVLFVFVAGTAQSQVGRDVVERGSNRSQIAQGQQALERDQQELAAFDDQLAALKAAVGNGDASGANQALAQIKPILDREVQQGAAMAEAAKREMAGSASETGSNRRESRRNRDDSAAFGRSDDDALDAARDGLNRADDARDVADDKSDLAAVSNRVQRQQAIGQTMQPYQVALGNEAERSDAAQKIGLLDEFQQLMQQGVSAVEQEIAEDRQEAGEDRRETRDDLREADEIDNRARRETGNAGRRRR